MAADTSMIAATLAASLPPPEIADGEADKNAAVAKARIAQYRQIYKALEWHSQAEKVKK